MALTPAGYRPRLIEEQLNKSLRSAGAVVIEGPRSCGKTWCARSLAESEYSLADPENGFSNRRTADIDPLVAITGSEPHLIDEWQEAPRIRDAVRCTIGQEDRKGRFILCGSAAADISGIMDSDAGRMMSVRMRTMSLYESGDSSGDVSLRSLFEGRFETAYGKIGSLDDLARLTARGGWPGLIGMDEEDVRASLKDMVDRICETDARKAGPKKRNVGKLKKTFRALAENESTPASKKKIASDTRGHDGRGVEEETVAEYMDVLEKLFIIEDQPAYSPDYRSPVRVGKAPKRHFTDPSLAVAAMGLDSSSLKRDLDTFGFMFEALCERDLRIYAQAIGGSLYHYRDHSGREIDAVVEVPGKGWGAFEIKLGGNQTDEAAKNLLKVDSFIRNDGKAAPPLFLCVLSGTEGFAYRRPDGVYVVPICMLGP